MYKIPLKHRTSKMKGCEVCDTPFIVHKCREKKARFCSAKCRINGIFTPEVRKKMSLNSARKNETPYNFKHDDKIAYSTVHNWIRRHYGKANQCEECGRTDAPKYEWANISGKYYRKREDFKQLCSSCHAIFDGRAYKSWITKRINYKTV